MADKNADNNSADFFFRGAIVAFLSIDECRNVRQNLCSCDESVLAIFTPNKPADESVLATPNLFLCICRCQS